MLIELQEEAIELLRVRLVSHVLEQPRSHLAGATVVAASESLDPWIAAIPAAVATVAVTALATFRLEEHWLRCRRAESGLTAEIALFEAAAEPYEARDGADPDRLRAQRRGRFVAEAVRVHQA